MICSVPISGAWMEFARGDGESTSTAKAMAMGMLLYPLSIRITQSIKYLQKINSIY